MPRVFLARSVLRTRLPRPASHVAAILTPLALLLGATGALAEPVSFTFNVQIEYRCTLDACERFPSSFPVTMTFDGAVSGSVDTPWNHERWYGVPTFSTIPLARPDVSPSATRMYTPAVDLTFVHDEGWRRVGHAYSGYEMTDGDGTYFNWNTSLYRVEDNVWPLPALTPGALAEFLGSSRGDGFFGFNFSGQLRGGGLAADSIGYLGTATLLAEPAPVPEPATVLLIGSGLVAICRRVGRRRTCPPHDV